MAERRGNVDVCPGAACHDCRVVVHTGDRVPAHSGAGIVARPVPLAPGGA